MKKKIKGESKGADHQEDKNTFCVYSYENNKNTPYLFFTVIFYFLK